LSGILAQFSPIGVCQSGATDLKLHVPSMAGDFRRRVARVVEVIVVVVGERGTSEAHRGKETEQGQGQKLCRGLHGRLLSASHSE
jgi:hypothetical protein